MNAQALAKTPAAKSALDALDAQRVLGHHDEAVEQWMRDDIPAGIADVTDRL